jgi:hypothetical protein
MLFLVVFVIVFPYIRNFYVSFIRTSPDLYPPELNLPFCSSAATKTYKIY